MKTLTNEQSVSTLPEGFTVRGATLADVDAALNLFNRWSQSVIHEDELTDADALRSEWASPGFDSDEDIRMVFTPDGDMIGYIEVWTTAKPPVHPWIWGRVDPAYEGSGIGTYLLTWAERRAKEVLDRIPTELRFAPQVGTYQQAEKPQKLFVEMGYKHIRSFYNMRINMEAPPVVSELPTGITLRTYNPETALESVYLAAEDSFRDHYGHVDSPFEEGVQRFKHYMTEYEGFDPTLWFIAMDGDEIAGICICRHQAYDSPDVGYINTLGVRRAWRKRGIGLALLSLAFSEFYRRGKRMAGLGVDAESLTGALRLYENAGMHVHHAFDRYEKEIRPGKEISVQSL
ncbi:MAG: GNAT family N-acetyltransferase [Chloroflexota bacterium]